MRRLSLASLVLSGLLFACASQSFRVTTTLEGGDEPVVLPAIQVKHLFVLPVEIAGEGEAEDRTLWMAYDTGAAYTSVAPDSLARVSKWRPGLGRRATVAEARIGPATITNLSVQADELDHIAASMGLPEPEGLAIADPIDVLTPELARELGSAAGPSEAEPVPKGDSVRRR